MNRSKLAALTNTPDRTIRFYEDRGIIPAPNRSANGYRDYDENLIPRLRFIKNAQKLGFSLGEIKELADMEVVPGSSCESAHKKAQDKIKDIELKITELHKIKNALERFTQHCSPEKGIGECEFLHLLEEQ